MAFIIQKQAYDLSQKPFIEAGVTIGVRPIRMISGYYLPNLGPEIIVNFFSDIARVVMLIGQLAILNVFISQIFVQTGYVAFSMFNTRDYWCSIIKETRRDCYEVLWIPCYSRVVSVLSTFT
ncbi:hypothetical protein, partial [Escherichia coli]|uniref:hypothetical protein n=1 Tax=Escherichia coli TaxID=562 RepID=UPI00192CF11C